MSVRQANKVGRLPKIYHWNLEKWTMNDHEIYLISLNLNQDKSSQKKNSKDKIVECIGNGMYLPSNQKQIKSPLITSDAVSCYPVTITIININEGEINQEQTKISFRFFVFLMVFCFPVLCCRSWTSLFHFITL